MGVVEGVATRDRGLPRFQGWVCEGIHKYFNMLVYQVPTVMCQYKKLLLAGIFLSKSMSQNRSSQGLHNSVSSGWSSITFTSFIFISMLELVYIISFELLRQSGLSF